LGRSRYHLRSDAVKLVVEQLEIVFAGDAERLVPPGANLEMMEGEWEDRLVMVDGEPLILVWKDRYFPTVRGAQVMKSRRRLVVVDMGAVPYVTNGAHVMGPGIVEADEEIGVGDLVVIAEERYGKALAIGQALVSGADMPGKKGRAVLNIHHVGDQLWDMQQ